MGSSSFHHSGQWPQHAWDCLRSRHLPPSPAPHRRPSTAEAPCQMGQAAGGTWLPTTRSPPAQFHLSLDHPHAQRCQCFSSTLKISALHELGDHELATENTSKYSGAPGQAPSSSLLKVDSFLSCCLDKDLGSNPVFDHLLDIWPWVKNVTSLSLSCHLYNGVTTSVKLATWQHFPQQEWRHVRWLGGLLIGIKEHGITGENVTPSSILLVVPVKAGSNTCSVLVMQMEKSNSERSPEILQVTQLVNGSPSIQIRVCLTSYLPPRVDMRITRQSREDMPSA